MPAKAKKKSSDYIKNKPKATPLSENEQIPERFNSSSFSIKNLFTSHTFNSSSINNSISGNKIIKYIS
jgi:hypothetical protein